MSILKWSMNSWTETSNTKIVRYLEMSVQKMSHYFLKIIVKQRAIYVAYVFAAMNAQFLTRASPKSVHFIVGFRIIARCTDKCKAKTWRYLLQAITCNCLNKYFFFSNYAISILNSLGRKILNNCRRDRCKLFLPEFSTYDYRRDLQLFFSGYISIYSFEASIYFEYLRLSHNSMTPLLFNVVIFMVLCYCESKTRQFGIK